MTRLIPRKRIEELQLLYSLHPERHDVYVEGTFDHNVLSHYAQKNNLISHVFYDADSFEVAEDLLRKYGLSRGRKQQLQVLAKELSHAKNAKLRCIVDRDLDHWFGEVKNDPPLFWTHYNTTECYYLDSVTIYDILVRTASAKVGDWDTFFQTFKEALKSLYVTRLAAQELGLNITNWLAPDKMLKKQNSSVIFDNEEYIHRLLLSNNLSAKKTEFQTIYAAWLTKLDADIRHCVRGHDFVNMMAWCASKFNGIKFGSDEIAGLLVLLAPTRNEFGQLLA